MLRQYSRILSIRPLRLIRTYANAPSAEDIAAQQHTGSRKAPQPTETGTSTQRPNDAPKSNAPSGQRLPDDQQQAIHAEETGSKSYMADTKDDLNGEIKSSTPFRAAPIDKKVGAKTIAPDLEANERK